MNIHSHGASAAAVEVAKIRTVIKVRAEACQEPPSSIISNSTGDVSTAAQGALPTIDSMKKMVRRKRNQVNLAPPNPLCVSDLVIPYAYQQYVQNNGNCEEFSIADSGQSDQRILIFGRKSWTVFLLDSDLWYADGTFKLSPPLFSQVYVLMAKKI